MQEIAGVSVSPFFLAFLSPQELMGLEGTGRKKAAQQTLALKIPAVLHQRPGWEMGLLDTLENHLKSRENH